MDQRLTVTVRDLVRAGSYAKPFRCYIRPRSEAAVLLVRNTECEE